MSVQKWVPPAHAVEGKVCWTIPFEVPMDGRYSEPEEWPVIALLRGQRDKGLFKTGYLYECETRNNLRLPL